MAEEIVDALVLQTRFDESGLDAQERAALEAARAFVGEINTLSSQIRPLDISTSELLAHLNEGGQEISRFFQGLTSELDAGAQQIGQAFGLTQSAVENLRQGIRSGIIEELQRFGFTAAEAARAASGLAQLPTPRIETGLLLQSGQQVVAGLLPPVRAYEEARLLLSRPIEVGGIAAAGAGGGLLPLVRELRQLPPAQQAVVANSRSMALTLRDQGSQSAVLVGHVRNLKAEVLEYGRAQAGVHAGQEAITRGFALSQRGMTRLTSGFTALAVQATGVPGPVGAIVSGLLLLGTGSLAVTGAAAGIALLALAYRAFTADARRAREATDEWIKAQLEAARARDPVTQIQRAFAGVSGEVEGVTARMTELNRQLVQAQSGLSLAGTPVRIDTEQIGRLKREMDELGAAAVEAGRQFRDRVLAEVDAVTNARLTAERQAGEDALALQRQALQASETNLRAMLAQELITREAFYAERLVLAQRAAQAEITALRSQREIAARTPARGDAEETTRASTVAHFDALIRLRQAGLQQQIGEIANEERLLELADQRRKLRALDGVIPRITLPPALILKPRVDTSEIQAAVESVVRLGDQLSFDEEFRKAAIEAQKLAEVVFGISQVADDLTRVANNLGLINDEGARAIQTLNDLGVAIATSNIFGIISAGIDLVGQIFGESEFDREHKRLLAENTEALRRLTDAQLAPLAQADLDAARQATGTIVADRDFLRTVAAAATSGPVDAALINALIAQFGVTLDELQRIAQTAIPGFTLIDDKGRVVAGAFELLDQAFREGLITIEAFREALGDATESAINVAGGFRQARFAFEAQIPGLGPNAPTQPTGALPPPAPADPGRTTPGRDRTKGPTLQAGEIHIHVVLPPGWQGDGVQLAQETREALRRESAATFGTSDDWSGT